MSEAVVAHDPYLEIFEGSGFIHIDTRTLNGRKIYKFVLEEDVTPRAIDAIQQLCRDFNQQLTAIFPLQGLRDLLGRCKYLTINGTAVCLAEEKGSPLEAHLDYVNRFFTETLIEAPVKCREDHCLELEHARLWGAKNRNHCPAGAHGIGNLQVDEELQERIRAFRASHSAQREEAKEQADKLRDLERKQEEQDGRLDEVYHQLGLEKAGKDSISRVRTSFSGGKVLVKIGAKNFAFEVARGLGKKELGKVLSKSIGRHAVPVASVALGVGFAVHRFKKNEFVKGLFELVSGGAVFIPLVGLLVSVGIDCILILHDYFNGSFTELRLVIQDLPTLYRLLYLNREPPPSREEVLQAYREAMEAVHTDKADPQDQEKIKELDRAAQIYNLVKEEIFKQRGWSSKE